MCVFLFGTGGHECGAHRGLKGVLDPLEQEFHAVVNHLMGVLGIKFRSAARLEMLWSAPPFLQPLGHNFLDFLLFLCEPRS